MFPVGAFGGRKDIMNVIAPLGPVYQAGTLSGNPVAMAAGYATLELITAPDFHARLSAVTEQLMRGLKVHAAAAGIPFHAAFVGGMFGLFFTDQPVHNEADTKRCNVEQFKQFFHGMLREGVYLAPSAFEAGFVSSAHGEQEIQFTLSAAARVFQQIR